jgi:SAM-dependent methyltransferase
MADAAQLYDEVANAGAAYTSTTAASYDAKAPFDPSDDVKRLRALGLDRTKTLVDLGAGTGRVAVAAARYAREVIAVDISPAMRELFEQRRRLLWARRVRYVEAGFLSYEHEGAPVDFVYSRNALQNLPDLWKVVALQRMHDLLRPGGVLFLRMIEFDYEPPDVLERLEQHLAALPTDPAKGFTREETVAALDTRTYGWLMTVMLERCGFTIEHARHGYGIFAEYVCRRAA